MGYYSKKNQGEICAKGPSRFLGYLKDEEKTKEVIDEDGWLHTGDIGMWLPNGTLKIIDRKKNLFKLSQVALLIAKNKLKLKIIFNLNDKKGEYVSPEKIESVYSRSPFIAQIIVEGNSLKVKLIKVQNNRFIKKYFIRILQSQLLCQSKFI